MFHMKQLPAEVLKIFDNYVEILLKWNKKINLTAYNKTDLYEEALSDCYAILFLLKHLQQKEILDVGTGYGMPGLVLKILEKDFNITLLDSSQKKVAFLEYVSRILDIDVSIYQKRLPDKTLKNCFSCIISKASMEEKRLVKVTKDLLKHGGWLIYFAGDKPPLLDKDLILKGVIHYRRSNGSSSNIIIRKKIC